MSKNLLYNAKSSALNANLGIKQEFCYEDQPLVVIFNQGQLGLDSDYLLRVRDVGSCIEQQFHLKWANFNFKNKFWRLKRLNWR